jgi:hypothetical protein
VLNFEKGRLEAQWRVLESDIENMKRNPG